jgi:hypothetical protein
MTVKKEWTEKAKCFGMDTELFFDKYEEDVDLRKAVDSLCSTCPVQRECVYTAVSRSEWGVWGGIYFEKGKMSKEFNSHKKNDEWFHVLSFLTMDRQ